ncbi:MAG: PAS domain S-box protein [Deltaproteobacteria bacterium]|nr:PAS domain S-box protein [Deltaproteobacteria bacterium]
MDKAKKMLGVILEALEDGIYIINQDFIVEFMNTSMEKVFGDGIGKKCHQVTNNSDKICPWCRASEVFKKGKTLHQEVHLSAVNKIYDIIELPIKNKDGTISKLAIYRDITQRKEREEKLKASEEDYRRLFDNVGCGVFISSKKGKFLNANKTLLDMLGYESKEEFLKIDITKDLYLRPQDRKKFREMIEQDGRVIDYEVDFKRKDGSVIPILLTGHARYDHKGKIIGYEGINVDKSQRREMEKKKKKTRLQLLQAEKMASLGKLAAGVAHQLNNPLGGITLYTKLIIEEYELEEKAREDLHRILKDAERCRDIVKELLEFSRQTQNLMQPHDINHAISRTLFLLQNQTLFQNIEIDKNLDSSLPPISVDTQQFNHLLMNIITNAADAMEGNGTLTIKTYPSLKNNKICIEISDTGPGIPENILPHIFEPFFTTKEEGKGTGLGLSLVYGIVENHNATITAKNKHDKGAAFIIEFPITVQTNQGDKSG